MYERVAAWMHVCMYELTICEACLLTTCDLKINEAFSDGVPVVNWYKKSLETVLQV
jgi:hypothetical protein